MSASRDELYVPLEWQPTDVPTIAQVRERLGDEEFTRRLLQLLDEMPMPTWRQMFVMWLEDAWWRFREALHAVRHYP